MRGHPLGDDGDRAAADGLVNERRAVGATAGEREEEAARHDAAAVNREAGDRAVESAFDGEDGVLLEEVGELGGHFKNVGAERRGAAAGGDGAVARLESGDERVVLGEIADHGRRGCRAKRLAPEPPGAVTGLMSR